MGTRPALVLLIAAVMLGSVAPVSAADHSEPDVAWVHGFGGADIELSDAGFGVAVDASGSAYVTGRFSGTVDFDPGSGERLLTSNGGSDIFVAKYGAGGDLVWAHGFGGSGDDESSGVAVDAAGNVYVTGWFSGSDVDFDPGSGERLLTSNGGSDIFVAKYDTVGDLAWAHGFGGAGSDAGRGVAVDASGNVYVTGWFSGSDVDFDPGPGERLLTSNGAFDIFVAKYGTDGDLAWAHGFGGGDIDQGFGVAVDASGIVYVTGWFSGTVDFGTGAGERLLTSNGDGDVFVAKYGAGGDFLLAQGFGGADSDVGFGVAVDASGNVYVTGGFSGSDVDFGPGSGEPLLTSNGGFDIFVAKYGTFGNLVWAHGFGGTGFSDQGLGVAVDAFGNVYITGHFGEGTDVDFDPGPGERLLTSNGNFDIFVAAYDTVGDLAWAHGFGAADIDQGLGVAVDASGNVYVAGRFFGTVDFDPGPGERLLTSTGAGDIFVLKFEEPPDPDPVAPPTVGLVDPTQGIWHLRNSAGVVTSFYYGNSGDYPFVGDWNCDGIQTPGLYRPSDGFVYLRNTNTQGIADVTFFFGNPGDVPIAGDFNGDGCDTVSVYRPSNQTFYIINQLGKDGGGLGAAQFSYVFGNPGDKPFTGDFNGNGQTTVGLHRESTGLVYFRNTHTQGNADAQFFFGNSGDRFVAGDWNADGIDSPAVFRSGNTTFYFRFTNTQGNADAQFVWGSPGWLPIAGTWGLG